MAYTPINWQTGDTITADRLNRCDNGWSVQNTQLFSETVTAVDQDGMISGTLAYSSVINSPTLTVTFDGNEYDCDRIIAEWGNFYGGYGKSGPDFSDYPFLIMSGDRNILYTQAAGTHTIAAAAHDVEVSAGFAKAVNSSVTAEPSAAVLCVPGVTSQNEIKGAALGFFYEPNDDTKMHIIVGIDAPCTIVPESSTLEAGFDRDGLFFVVTR